MPSESNIPSFFMERKMGTDFRGVVFCLIVLFLYVWTNYVQNELCPPKCSFISYFFVNLYSQKRIIQTTSHLSVPLFIPFVILDYHYLSPFESFHTNNTKNNRRDTETSIPTRKGGELPPMRVYFQKTGRSPLPTVSKEYNDFIWNTLVCHIKIIPCK